MIIDAKDLPIEEYHRSAPQWLSKTSIRDFDAHGPAWWRMAYIDRCIERQTPDGAEQGLAIDCLLTEGADAFAKRYPMIPADAPRRPDRRKINAKKPSDETLRAIEWWRQWDAEHVGARMLSDEDRIIASEAADAVRALPCWADICKASAQCTVRRSSDSLGLGLQSRPDWLDCNCATVWDLKKTRSLANFGKQAIDLGYHLQAAIAGWCLAGDNVMIEHAYLVAVEWERGARARCFEIPQEALLDGDRRMRSIACDIAYRISKNDWTDRQTSPQPLPIPDWMMRRMEATA